MSFFEPMEDQSSKGWKSNSLGVSGQSIADWRVKPKVKAEVTEPHFPCKMCSGVYDSASELQEVK